MGLGKPGRLRVDQPTITGELGPAPDAYTHYSPVMIAALSINSSHADCRPERLFFPGEPDRPRPTMLTAQRLKAVIAPGNEKVRETILPAAKSLTSYP